MRRRSFLASLAAFFGFGAAVEAEAGSRVMRLEDLAAANGFDQPVITPIGHVFRCENGHPICEAVKTLIYGHTENWQEHIGRWRQREPAAGDPFPRCVQCGARIVFWRNARGINAI